MSPLQYSLHGTKGNIMEGSTTCSPIHRQGEIGTPDDLRVRYQGRMVLLMVAQASVLCAASTILVYSDSPGALSSLLPASKALSFAGILTQMVCHRGIPFLVQEAFSSVATEGTWAREVAFVASLWVPFIPFSLSVILLCLGARTCQWFAFAMSSYGDTGYW